MGDPVSMQKKFLFTILMVLMALVSSTVLAELPSRPASEAEKQFFNRAIETCVKAATGYTSTWAKIDEAGQDPEEFTRLSPGSENAPLVYHYYIEWADQERIDKTNSEISAALAPQAASLEKTAEEIDVKQLEDLAEQIAAAATAGNASEVERLNRQAEEISAKSDQLFSESDRATRETIEKLAARDARVVIRIGINQFYQGFDAEPIPGTLADGTPFYRVENGRMYNESWVEGTTFVLFGPNWKTVREDAGTAMESPEQPDKPHTAVQTVVIAVEAEQQRALGIINRIDLKSLRDLLN